MESRGGNEEGKKVKREKEETKKERKKREKKRIISVNNEAPTIRENQMVGA